MRHIFLMVIGTLMVGCVTTPPDYTAFKAHMPNSILVLPPQNHSLEVPASNSYYSVISRPIAEKGFYVFPVALVDAYFKSNGIVSPEQAHKLPPKKLREIFGADAAFYVNIKEWGNEYSVFSSNTKIKVECKLVDLQEGKTLWKKNHFAVLDSGASSGGLLGAAIQAAIVQVVRESTDVTRDLAKTSSFRMIHDRQDGFLSGPFKKNLNPARRY